MTVNLGDILIRTGVLSRADIEEAVGWQVLYGDRIGTNLLELGLISEESLAGTLGKQLGCEWACGELQIDPKLVAMVPASIARRNEVVPWRIDGRKLRMLCISPAENIALFDEIGHRLGRVVKPVVAPEFRIHQLLRRHYGSTRQLRSLDFGFQVKDRTGVTKVAKTEEPTPSDLMDDDAFSEMYEKGAAGRAVAGLMGEPPRWSGSEPPPARKPTLIRPPAVGPDRFALRPPAVSPPEGPRSLARDPESLAPEEAAELIELREIVEDVEPASLQPSSLPSESVITQPPGESLSAMPTDDLPAAETEEQTSLLMKRAAMSSSYARAESLPSMAPAVSLAPPISVTPPLPGPPAYSLAPPSLAPSRGPSSGAPSFGSPSDARFVSPISVAPPLPPASVAPSLPPDSVEPPLASASVAPSVPQASAVLTTEVDAFVESIEAEQWDTELGDLEEFVLSARHEIPPPPDMSPMTFDEALAAIGEATDRNGVARSVLRYARSQAARAMLLSVQGDVALGWDAAGDHLDQDVARSVALPLTVPSAFRLVRASRSHYLGPLARETGNIRFLKEAGKQWPASAVLLPILFRGRVVYILYVDNGHKKYANANVGELLLLSQHITRSVEQMIARRQSAAAA